MNDMFTTASARRQTPDYDPRAYWYNRHRWALYYAYRTDDQALYRRFKRIADEAYQMLKGGVTH